MVKAVQGTLIQTEPSIKEIITRVAEYAVIEDINETTIFIKTEYFKDIKQQVDKIIANATKQNE